MPLPLFQVDAFTSQPFKGNPAAVCLMDGSREDGWMRDVAAEMNLSETAFLLPRSDGYELRWFTPTVEVALCGHATLASAHVLWETGLLRSAEQARFHTKSGLLTADRREEWIELDLPVKREVQSDPPPDLLEALGCKATYVGKNQFDYLVEVADESSLRALRPDHKRLSSLGVRGVIVTSRGSQGFDFVSRFFAPGSGIDEDPVTGSAHCCLGPYWEAKLGKSEFRAFQASERGGEILVRVEGDRVKLSGKAVTVLRGELA
ncbi:MAG TPA: PhzF family phenazine biosynthesis protein [Thermoanaerobaculia bacterium]|nr:PhzF family phenazine biosynthesis protein [Thermoanaerobaculia bacterium]